MLRLLSLTAPVVHSVADPDEFARLTGAALGEAADLVRDVVAQHEAHRAATGAPPEWGGFLVVATATEPPQVVGTCAFVDAPNAAGEVEIAYFTFPDFEGRGYARAMAGALFARAAAGGARLVYAHTLPEPGASTRILEGHGFRQVGRAQDHEAGVVWRWERRVDASAS